MKTFNRVIQDNTEPTQLCTKQEEVKKTQDYCESVLASVIDSIQRRYLSVRELIGAQAEAAAAQVQISSQTLQVKMEKMRKRSHELDQLAQTDSDVHFLEVLRSHHWELYLNLYNR